ncbi:MAG: hypothetical protein AAF333_17390 [Planctomycetota bacterium]
MQEIETRPVSESVPSFDASASDTSFGSGLGPVAWGLMASAFAGVAAAPVLSAVIGPVEHFGLIAYPAMILGGIVGFSGLLVAGLASNAAKAWRGVRRGTAERRGREPQTIGRGQLALD